MNVRNFNEFQASYDYGPKEEQIQKKSFISVLINDLIVRLFKSFIFPGASFFTKYKWIDPERIKNAENLLISYGQHVTMTTPDGDKIDGMYLTAQLFRNQLERFCDVEEIENSDGTIEQNLHLKPQLREEGEESVYLKLKNIRKNTPKLDIAPLTSSHPTVLISTGAGMSYAGYKHLALSYLQKGMNVMMVDFRGYGKSQGSPTDTRTKLDLETAYQYLQTRHNLKNEHLIVHGHCLGGGPASDLAARRPGVNLLLDRTFAEYRDVAREQFPIISKLIYAIMPWIVNYNNAENLRNVKGHIAIAMASNDQVIPQAQNTKLINHLPKSQPNKVVKLLNTTVGHTGIWINEDEDASASRNFDDFLEKTNLRRRLF